MLDNMTNDIDKREGSFVSNMIAISLKLLFSSTNASHSNFDVVL